MRVYIVRNRIKTLTASKQKSKELAKQEEKEEKQGHPKETNREIKEAGFSLDFPLG